MKQSSILLLFLISSTLTFTQEKNYSFISNNPKNIVKTIIATGALCLMARMIAVFTTPDKLEPTLESLNMVTFKPSLKENKSACITSNQLDTFLRSKDMKGTIDIKGECYNVQAGLPDHLDNVVTLISDGYPCHSRPLPLYPHNLIKSGAIKGTVIHFTYPGDHNRAQFNFCQENDIRALNLAVNTILKVNKDINIHIYGLCKGGTTVLRYLAQNPVLIPTHIKSAVIESPPLSLKAVAEKYPFGHSIVRLIFPHYTPQGKTFLDDTHFPNIPILMGAIEDDHIASLNDIEKVYEQIITLKNTVNENPTETTLFKINQPTAFKHGKMPQNTEYVNAVQNFYTKYTDYK